MLRKTYGRNKEKVTGGRNSYVMRSFVIFLFVGYKKDDQVVIGQIVEACGTKGREVVDC